MAFDLEKIGIAFDSLKKNNIDMWIVAGQESATKSEPVLDILSDGEFIGLTALIFTSDRKARIVCTPIDVSGYEMTGVFNETYPFPISFEQTLAEVIKKVNPRNIALDYSKENASCDGLTLGTYTLIEKALKIADFKGEILSAEKIVIDVRGIKTEKEIEKIKNACEKTQEIFEKAKSFIKPGLNCQDIYAFFEKEVEDRGYGYSWPKSANPGVNSGFGCPGGHCGAPDWPVKKGDLVNVDFGITIDGYSSDIQRMYYLLDDGEDDAPKDIKEAFYAVRDGIELAAKGLVPGKTGLEVDSIARDYIMGLGYPSWNAALGHQLGKVAHDGGPCLAPKKPRYDRVEIIGTPLSKNMVFTLEPGIETRKGRIGLEEDVVVKEDGAHFLIPPQKELYLLKEEEKC